MASNGSTATAVITRYKLYNYVQWELWYSLAKDKAEGHDLWKYVDPGAKDDAPTVPVRPARPKPGEGATKVDKVAAEDYAYDLRKFERQEAAFSALRTWIKESIDATCFVHIQDEHIPRKMLQILKQQYDKATQEIIPELDSEFNRLRKPPRRQDIVSWTEQWNHLYRRAKRANHTKCTDYGASLEFIKASKSVNPEFAQSARSTVMRSYVNRESIQTIPELTKWLLMEQQIDAALLSADSASTGFATHPGLDTDNHTASSTSKPADQPKGNTAPTGRNKKPPRECLCGQLHLYADCPYLIPSVRPNDWVADPQIMTQVSDALNRSEKKQQIIRKLVEKSNGSSNNDSDSESDEASPARAATSLQQEDEQSGGIKTNFFILDPKRSEGELNNAVLLDSGASNHIFNRRDRFITYTPCINNKPVYAGTTLVEVKGIGMARVTVTTQTGKLDITLRNALYVPSYKSNTVSQAILQEQGAFHRPETQEIVHNGKHLCQVIRRGKHYILETITNPESPPQQDVATVTGLPELSQTEDTTNDMHKEATGLITPEIIQESSSGDPELNTPSSTPSHDPATSSGAGHEPTGPETHEEHSLGIPEIFAPGREQAAIAASPQVTQETAANTTQPPSSHRQRRTEPANTAPRSQEISANPNAPENILPSRTRGKQRRLEYGLLAAQVEQDSGSHTAFHAAMKHWLHQSTPPATLEHYSDLENHPYWKGVSRSGVG